MTTNHTTADQPDGMREQIYTKLELTFEDGFRSYTETVNKMVKVGTRTNELEALLRRHVLTAQAGLLEDILNYLPPSTSGQPDLVRVSQILYAKNRLAALRDELAGLEVQQ